MYFQEYIMQIAEHASSLRKNTIGEIPNFNQWYSSSPHSFIIYIYGGCANMRNIYEIFKPAYSAIYKNIEMVLVPKCCCCIK